MIYFAIFSGCLVAIALAIFIYSHLTKARLKKEKQKAIVEKHMQEHQERQAYICESIDIIIKALNTDQVATVEASIRLKVLVDQLKPMLTENSFPVIEQVYEKTKDIPRLKEWKALDKKQRRQFTREIESIENEWADKVKAETKILADKMRQRTEKVA